jgi:uncharacterized membrane protein YraQ (UPF0718 family)
MKAVSRAQAESQVRDASPRSSATAWKKEWKALLLMAGVFLAFYFLPTGAGQLEGGVMEALYLARDYARQHVITCLIPAFFIAGAIAVFVGKASVLKYLGPQAKKVVSYGVASVSGSILAVCSCTVLPLFAGIYEMGAGLGPAVAFLYAGPAINVLAIILTARVLGMELGIARAVGAIVFSVVIGLLMQLIFGREKREKQRAEMVMPPSEDGRPLSRTVLYFAAMIAVLVFANWGSSGSAGGFWHAVHSSKWTITSLAAAVLGVILVAWYGVRWWKVAAVAAGTIILAAAFPRMPAIPFAAGAVGLAVITATSRGEPGEWFDQTWGFTKQILPLLFAGVLVAGFLLGRPGHEGVIPSEWISRSVGGNSVGANLFSSVVGAFMYFATLTEVPILQGLIGNGMGKGPALALLLAGPALSLPNMLVIRSVIGGRKTVVYVLLVVAMSTVSGLIYGAFF